MPVLYRLLPVVALVIVSLGSHAEAAIYTLSPSAKNRVEFHSKATLESFSGKARNLSATFEVDPSDLSRASGEVTVDLRTLDTGIGLRNQHMRENHLHTDSFPNAIFRLDSVTTSGSTLPMQVQIHGRMTIHGTTNSITAKGSVTEATPVKSGALRLQTEFPLKITAYGISRPEFLFLKLAEDVSIVVDLTIVPKMP